MSSSSASGHWSRRSAIGAKGVTWKPAAEVAWLREANGSPEIESVTDRPSLYRPEYVAEAILALSGATNGRIASEGFATMQRRVGRPLTDLVAGEADARIRWSDVQVRPQKTLTSPEWSGNEAGDRQYSAFTINVERLVPWRTLTGRMQFFLDHAWVAELGEQLPIYRPPLNMPEHYPETADPGPGAIVLRYLTPHSKWSIHTDYQDDLLMLTLVSRRPGAVALAGRRRRDRRGRQRLDRDVEPQRRARLPRRGLAPPARGHLLHVSRQGPPRAGAAHREDRPPERHPQLAYPPAAQAHAHDRRLRPAFVCPQLLRLLRLATR